MNTNDNKRKEERKKGREKERKKKIRTNPVKKSKCITLTPKNTIIPNANIMPNVTGI